MRHTEGHNLTRIVQFFPAWDKRSDDPRKNYGVHGVEILFVLKGPEGAVQFRLSTSWMLPEVQKEQDSRAIRRGIRDEVDLCQWHPMPTDLGYHSPVRRGQYQESPISESCEWLDGRPCYYDGSSLNAEPVFERLLREGDAGVWLELESYYAETFLEAPRTRSTFGELLGRLSELVSGAGEAQQHVDVLLDFARKDDRKGFRDLARCLGVKNPDELWSGARCRLGLPIEGNE